jgi:predicted transcriptional regulator
LSRTMPSNDDLLLDLTAEVVSAYVRNNPVPTAALGSLIADISNSLKGLGGNVPPAPVTEPTKNLKPTVNPKKSVFPEYIVSLEDGKRYKTLKRTLGKLGLTPETYRAKWNLPVDYAMVAPAYSARRSAMAKGHGFGRHRPSKAEKKAS